MTVSTTDNRVSYAGNGVTTAFSFPNLFFSNSDLVVLKVVDATGVSTTQVLDTDYTVTGAANPAGGTVTMTTAPASGTTLIIYRDPAITQTIDLVNGDPFDVETGVERGFDKAVLVMQRLDELVDRSMRLADSDTSGASVELPSPVANKLLGWNSTANGIENKTPVDLSLSTVSAFINTLLDDSTAAEATATILDFSLLSAETAPDAADLVPIKDSSAGTTDTVTFTVLAEAIRALLTAKSGSGAAANYSLSASVAANALTITLSGYDGTALSSTNKAQFAFRSATAATGTTSTVDATANLTLTISSGSTLGTTSAVPARFWIVLFNDAGTLRLGAINCSTSTAIYPLSDDTLASSTAEGGAGAADSAGVIYTGSAVTAKAMRVLGYVEHTQATAGTYATTPSKVQLWQPGMKLPGDIVQSTRNTISTLVSGNTIFPADNTIPQNTEGMSILDATPITPTSTANFLRTRANTFGADTVAGQIGLGLFRDSVAGALAAVSMGHSASANYIAAGSIEFMEKAPSTSAITYKLRGGPEGLNTTYFGSGTGTVLYGGVAMTSIVVEELMG